MGNFYLERFGAINQLIDDIVDSKTGIIVTLPSFKEPNILPSIFSLLACQKPDCRVEVIVLINQPENADEEITIANQKTIEDLKTIDPRFIPDWMKLFYIFQNDLPKKHAGVGLARKIAMDEAVRRFEEIHHPNGIITCFDADTICDENYFIELLKCFQSTNCGAASIYFEHPLLETNGEKINEAIIAYEFHLRYYVNMQRFCGHPYAFHTIGSSMAARNSHYQKYGGMNKRKAGEDFYFLQKFIENEALVELNTTKLLPSPRISDRVPFGTGRAIGDFILNGKNIFETYSHLTFWDLKIFLDQIDTIYETDRTSFGIKTIDLFLEDQNFWNDLLEIKKSSKDLKSFRDKFYRWFNGLRVMKFAHFCRDHFYPNIGVLEAAKHLCSYLNYGFLFDNHLDALTFMRRIDKNYPSRID